MTMKQKLLEASALLVAVLALFSCEKFTEDEAFGGKEANSTLVVRTRAAQGDAAGTEGEVSYPVNVYVFDDADACVAVQQIASGEDELSLPLPEGTYSVYAISGADAAAYELPVKENATKDAPLAVKDGLTPEQRFFLAYAGVWANNIRPEAVLQMTKIDVHSLGEWRVNGALPHIGAWYDAFGVTDQDPMFIPVAERVSIW